MSLTHSACGIILHHYVLSMVQQRSGDQTGQGISNSTGPEVVVFNETQQQPHITAKAAEGSQPISEWFGAIKV